jgi:hypothetical protein
MPVNYPIVYQKNPDMETDIRKYFDRKRSFIRESANRSWLFPESHFGASQIERGQGQRIVESAGQGLLIAEPVDVGGVGTPIRLGKDNDSIPVELIPVIEEAVAQDGDTVKPGESLDNLLRRHQAVRSDLLP